MMMRYRGGGVGHAATRQFTRILEEDALSQMDSSKISVADPEFKSLDSEDLDSEISSGMGEEEDEEGDYSGQEDYENERLDDNDMEMEPTGAEFEDLELVIGELGPEDGEADDLGAEDYEGYAEF